MPDKPNILFICTGNACRSQIAEAWANHLKHNDLQAFSAGVYPIGVSSRAIQTMAEVGIDMSEHYSKHIDELQGIDFTYVITLCDNAKSFCPIFPASAKMIHMPIHDPYGATGPNDQQMAVFRSVRDKIRDFVEKMPENLSKEAIS
ncbi:MAG: arsenate reductase ArsC [Planctomycetota bacterium]|jgi:arsenate reductase